MKMPYLYPDPSGTERAKAARDFRDLATEVARLRPQALTRSNGEELDLGPAFPANFTKGLAHDENGLLEKPEDYRCLVEAINSPNRTLFEKHVATARSGGIVFKCRDKTKDREPPTAGETKKTSEYEDDGKHITQWRAWESPRAGHVYELEGPDPGAVGMSPAPKIGTSEVAAEIAEVYALAILRDVPFKTIAAGGKARLCQKASDAEMSASEVVTALNSMPFFSGTSPVSATPHQTDKDGLNQFERRRRQARTQTCDLFEPLTTDSIFRGSTRGAMEGPYISQFLLSGVNSLAGPTGGAPSYPQRQHQFDAEDGFIPYGTQVIDQRVLTHRGCLDYMTDWTSWLDVQNGANFKGADQFEDKRRFITTPRDLATYVHFDALYQAYLNACLILLANGTPASKGFPEPSASGNRDAFATFGGPHILSLVTEVATRCLKAVRRQKFNYHRRARPETLGGRLLLAATGTLQDALDDESLSPEALASIVTAFEATLGELPSTLKSAIEKHNKAQNLAAVNATRHIDCKTTVKPSGVSAANLRNKNLLLPMAFPEGSPMHPAYGAGHATVAGGCVTMLKAFFEMFDPSGRDGLRVLKLGDQNYMEPNNNGTRLVNRSGLQLTVQGELDKLAANISIGRNMAGVHYYSDYYDSLRLGERIALGILMEQAPTYGDEMEVSFDSFDGDRINIVGEAGTCPTLSVIDQDGDAVLASSWWLRHVTGEEIIVDN